jgi:hypothetical protein
MEKRESRSDPGRQAELAWGCLAAGAALSWFLRAAGGPWMSSERAAFRLGILLLVIGLGGVLAHGAQTIVVDPANRAIVVEDETRLGRKARTIPFGDVVEGWKERPEGLLWPRVPRP